MFRKFITAFIGLAIFVSFSPATQAYEYKDIPRDSIYFYPVDYLRRNDVFKDTAYFRPDILISKAEFIKYLVTLNSPEFRPGGNVDLPFEDTRDTAWYASYFKEAIKLGILDERERFVEPDKKLSLIDALTLLFRSQGLPIPNVYKGNIPFSDVQRNKSAAPLIMKAVSWDLFRPQRQDYAGIYKRISRVDAAYMIYKLDLVSIGTPTSSGPPTLNQHGAELSKIIDVWNLLESAFVDWDDVNRSKVADEAIRALVDQLGDPYSSYLDEEENQAFFDDIDGEIEGIGAVIGFNDDEELTIISPIKDAPAEKAGLKAGDVVKEVDDQDVTGMDLFGVVDLIKGPKGTTVKLRVKRGSSFKTFIIERATITIPSTEVELIDGGDILHLKLFQFNRKAPEQFKEAIDQIATNSNIMGLIIDVRDNPGGLLDSVVRILGHFLERESQLVTIEYVDFDQTIYSRGKGELSGFPIVVLTNTGSASASEILAGALKDYDLATIVGETTFGKGTVQEVSYFLDNSSVKLTVAKWLTPDGHNLQEGGVVPDVIVKDVESTAKDEQLDKAIEELHKLMR